MSKLKIADMARHVICDSGNTSSTRKRGMLVSADRSASRLGQRTQSNREIILRPMAMAVPLVATGVCCPAGEAQHGDTFKVTAKVKTCGSGLSTQRGRHSTEAQHGGTPE